MPVFLTPAMLNICVALDAMDEESGCLEVVVASHEFGRFDHVLLDADGRRLPAVPSRRCNVPMRIGVDPDRLSVILDRRALTPAVLALGDLVVFHGNSIHRSSANRSARPRRAVICCFYAKSNSPVRLISPLGEVTA
jgi:ectoine hydroxylase